MANNLLAKGYPLVVYDVIESCVEGAVKNGAVKASSPAEVRINYNTTHFSSLNFFQATFRETPPPLRNGITYVLLPTCTSLKYLIYE